MTGAEIVAIIGAISSAVVAIISAWRLNNSAQTLKPSLDANTVATNASKDATMAHTAALVAGTGDGGTTVVNVSAPPTQTATPVPPVR